LPELLEVEVTRRRIAPVLVGRRFATVRTGAQSYFFLTPPARLRRELPGRRVLSLARLGKYLVARLDDGAQLLLHLGMTGQLFAEGARSPRLLSAARRAALAQGEQPSFRGDAHTHLRLAFEDGPPELWFRDVRKFGKVQLLAPGEPSTRLARLGTDALALRGDDLHRAARSRQVAVKTLLLDQSVVAGSGNIYADEALFLAGVRPTRRAGRLSRAECDAIAAALQGVMERAIESGGSSIQDFLGPDGSDGAYQDEHQVYGRAGKPCPRCGAALRRIVLGQRSAHFCARCQR
jgi:formamidopyrimidine-DNA glycosylase